MDIRIRYNLEEGWVVSQGMRYADRLTYEEMIGLVAALTMPEKDKRKCLQWMLTQSEHDSRNGWVDDDAVNQQYQNRKDNA